MSNTPEPIRRLLKHLREIYPRSVTTRKARHILGAESRSLAKSTLLRLRVFGYLEWNPSKGTWWHAPPPPGVERQVWIDQADDV